jgi:hypothetical protein
VTNELPILERQVGVANAEQRIQYLSLYARYVNACDFGTEDDFAMCFTGSGELIVTEEGHRHLRAGRDEIREWRSTMLGQRTTWTRHWYSRLSLDRLSTEAIHGHCYMFVFRGRPEGPPFMAACGVWDDTIHIESSQWRFARRHLSLDYATADGKPPAGPVT